MYFPTEKGLQELRSSSSTSSSGKPLTTEEGSTAWLLALTNMCWLSFTSTKASERRNQTTHIPLPREELSPMGSQRSEQEGMGSECCNPCYVNEGESPHHHLLAITGKHLQKHHMKIILKHRIYAWKDVMSFLGPLLLMTSIFLLVLKNTTFKFFPPLYQILHKAGKGQ